MKLRPERITRARIARGLSQYELAAIVQVGRPRLGAWETGRNGVPRAVEPKLADALEVSVGWLRGEGSEALPEPRTAPLAVAPGFSPPAPGSHPVATERVGRTAFPLLGIAGAAAFPVRSEEMSPDDFVEFSDDLFVRGAEQFAVRVWGDSMEPRFRHGDYVLVVKDPNFRVPGRCVVAMDPEGRYLVKGLFRSGAGWELRPANEKYPICPMEARGWEMIGYVIGWRRERGRGSYLEEGDRAGLTFD